MHCLELTHILGLILANNISLKNCWILMFLYEVVLKVNAVVYLYGWGVDCRLMAALRREVFVEDSAGYL